MGTKDYKDGRRCSRTVNIRKIPFSSDIRKASAKIEVRPEVKIRKKIMDKRTKAHKSGFFYNDTFWT